MKKTSIISLLALLSLVTLYGCRVDKLSIVQGNIVNQKMVDQLKPGMTKDQVRFIMGDPLISDTFHQNRWDFIYTIKPAYGKETHRQVTIFFDNQEKMTHFIGNLKPSGDNEQESSS